jgi:hypothetical protein
MADPIRTVPSGALSIRPAKSSAIFGSRSTRIVWVEFRLRLDPVQVAIPGYFAVTGLIRESRLQEIPGYWLPQSPFPLS